MSELSSTPESLRTALPEVHLWPERPTLAALSGIPNCPAVYLLTDAAGVPVQLATTQALRRLLTARFVPAEAARSGRADLAAVVRAVRWRALATAFEGRWWYYRLARELHPNEYLRLISFGPVWFLHVDWGQRVPELRVTERVWCVPGEFVGPWLTRQAAQDALCGLWDLFDLCRYPVQVRKTPHGVRCAYADMHRCDAPCDGSAPPAAYMARCRAAWQFATGGVGDWIVGAAPRMAQASARREYELAGLVHQQLRFARTWEEKWSSRVRSGAELSSFLLLPATRRKAWKAFLFRSGHLAEGPLIAERRLATEAANWVREAQTRSPEALPGTVLMEQTWLVCQWEQNREAEAALRFAPGVAAQPDLERAIGAQLAARRSCGAGESSEWEDGSVDRKPCA